MVENKEKIKKFLLIIIIAIICGIIFFYQTKKIGFHEDEGYTIASSVNPDNGLMSQYLGQNTPQWLSKEYVTNYVSLSPNNYLNFKALYLNQAYDNHPPFFYTLVHFSSILFSGQFSTYTVFVVNIIAFILSLIVLEKILKLLGKDNLIFPTLIFYGLSMGTISMVIFQRMYMLLTFFILLYFYYSLKIYTSDFKLLDKKNIIIFGIITILGFLTQYYFAIYAFLIFILMIIKMFRNKIDKKIIRKYFVCHVVYAVIGILAFVPCISHLFFSSRGLTNLSNTNYFSHFVKYLGHLAYAFSIQNNILSYIIFILFLIAVFVLLKKGKDRFIVSISILPSIIYFFIAVKLTSFQELRYIMPVIPFVCLTLFFILDYFIKSKYKNIIMLIIAVILSIYGLAFSKPLFLYEDYKESLDIANSNSEKSFVYVYDNYFNHMQSIPEMMIYSKTLIINKDNDELKYIINDENLKNEDSFILCIKSYFDNDVVINEIINNTEFKNVTTLYKVDRTFSEMILNNLYLVSK